MQNYGDYLYFPGTSSLKNKIFAFDLDGTLTVYKDGQNPIYYNKTSPFNYNFICKIEKIKELNQNYTIFIITNQFNITSEKLAFIENIWKSLEMIPHIFIANKKNQYRKPNNGFMYLINYILNSKNIYCSPLESYYCGDAVDKYDPFVPYRWSNDDSQFAKNCGLCFVRPIDVLGNNYELPETNFVMMMGNPGSYKTTYAKYLESNLGYIRFSQDECGELTKLYSQIEAYLINGYKIVIDATFANSHNRQLWIDLSIRINKQLTIVWMIRDGRPFNAIREKPIIHFAYSTYTKSFRDPEFENMPYKLIKNY